MPKDIITYSTCAGPDTAVPFSRIGGITGALISGFFGGSFGPVLTAVLDGGLLLLLIALWGWGAICVLAPIAAMMAVEIKYWYYNRRLLCIQDPECAIGEVMAKPDTATDGDRKLNLLLAPYAKSEVRHILAVHLDRNRTVLSDPANFPSPAFDAVPVLPSLAELVSPDPSALKGYMGKLSGKLGEDSDIYNQMTIGVVDTLLQPIPGADGKPRNFFNRFYRKDPAHIDPLTWNAIPVDFALPPAGSWQLPNAIVTTTYTNPVTQASNRPLNPMFRFASDHLIPYLHCEIEGHQIAIWMDDVLVAASGMMVGCLFFGPLGALILGFLAWLFKKFLDWVTGNDGDAAEPEVDWDDPDLEAPTVYGEHGSTVAVHGGWIMDTEHEQYFEIHPVRAYYVLDVPGAAGGGLTSALINATRAQEICKGIRAAETGSLGQTLMVPGATALSYGMGTRYGGGGEPPEVK